VVLTDRAGLWSPFLFKLMGCSGVTGARPNTPRAPNAWEAASGMKGHIS
jgi:hypothetical protein